MTRDFVTSLYGAAETAVAKGRNLKETMAATREVMDRSFPVLRSTNTACRSTSRARFDEASGITIRDLDRQTRPGNVAALQGGCHEYHTSPDAISRGTVNIRRVICLASATVLKPRPCPGRCRSGAISPQRCAYGSTPNSCPARPSRRRAQ